MFIERELQQSPAPLGAESDISAHQGQVSGRCPPINMTRLQRRLFVQGPLTVSARKLDTSLPIFKSIQSFHFIQTFHLRDSDGVPTEGHPYDCDLHPLHLVRMMVLSVTDRNGGGTRSIG
jgi:hypothetical protein